MLLYRKKNFILTKKKDEHYLLLNKLIIRSCFLINAKRWKWLKLLWLVHECKSFRIRPIVIIVIETNCPPHADSWGLDDFVNRDTPLKNYKEKLSENKITPSTIFLQTSIIGNEKYNTISKRNGDQNRG